MTNSFGYLTKEGYGGHVFPVVFGEVGSHLTAVRTLHYSAAASPGGAWMSANTDRMHLKKKALWQCH